MNAHMGLLFAGLVFILQPLGGASISQAALPPQVACPAFLTPPEQLISETQEPRASVAATGTVVGQRAGSLPQEISLVSSACDLPAPSLISPLRAAVSGNPPHLVLLGEPTSSTLAYFMATPLPAAIDLEWGTTTEADILGFNLFRADDMAGEPEPLNQMLIPSKHPGSSIGAQYQFTDDAVVVGATYYYWLDVLDVQSGATRYGPVNATADPYRIWLPIIVR